MKLAYKKAVEETELIWEWLCDNPEKTKMDFNIFNIGKYYLHCPMCQYCKFEDGGTDCDKCFLNKGHLCNGGRGRSYKIFLWKCFKKIFDDKSYKARLAIYNACLEERLRIMAEE